MSDPVPVTAVVGGTPDTFVVCAGAGATVAQKTVAQVKTLLDLSGENTGDQDLSALAPKDSPALTGTPTAPTATGGTNTTQIATTAFVGTAVAAVDLSGKVSKAGDTITGPIVQSQASTVSTPAEKFTGSWYTGGSTTTNKPHVLIEPAGTTSSAWNANGTGLGINAASGFSGNIIDCFINSSNLMRLTAGGVLSAPQMTASTITATGYFTTTGFGVMLGYISSGMVRIGSTGGVAWAQSANAADTLDLGVFRKDVNGVSVTAGENNTTYRDLTCRAISTTSGVSCGAVTYAVLSATTATVGLGEYRVTDRANRRAYPDGTNWRWVADDAIIS